MQVRMKNDVSDSDLICAYYNGDEQAFATLVERHTNRLYTAIYMIVKDSYVAEDILQETFIKAIKTIKTGKYNEEGKFAPWISRIAHNLAIDHFRKNKRYPMIVMEDGSSVFDTIEFADESHEDVRIRTESHEQLRYFIQQLPKAQKEVLIMRHYMNMSFQEIADTTHVSINTALGRMRYALINLRKLMGNDYERKSNKSYQK